MKSFRNNYADFCQFFVELHNPKLFSLAFNKQTSFEKKPLKFFGSVNLTRTKQLFGRPRKFPVNCSTFS